MRLLCPSSPEKKIIYKPENGPDIDQSEERHGAYKNVLTDLNNSKECHGLRVYILSKGTGDIYAKIGFSSNGS